MEELITKLFDQYCTTIPGELTAEEIQEMHADLRIGGISLPQVQASLKYACGGDTCEMTELVDALQEMDRRYFLIQNLRWEFSLLDGEMKDSISEEQARWFKQIVHGEFFSKRKWEHFLQNRLVPGSGVTFPEIEVELCNIPSKSQLLEDEEAERKEREEQERKRRELEEALERERRKRQKRIGDERKRREEEEERRKKDEAKRRKEEEDEKLRRKKMEEDEARRRKLLEEEEERGRIEAANREKRKKADDDLCDICGEKKSDEKDELMEMQRLQKLEEIRKKEREKDGRDANDIRTKLKKAVEDEKAAEDELNKAQDALKNAKDGKEKKEAEQRLQRAQLHLKEARNRRIRLQLALAIKLRDYDKLRFAVDEFKKYKLPDTDGDLYKAERILLEFRTRDGLQKAIKSRKLKALEEQVAFARKNGLEIPLAPELIEANELIIRLRRLERIRAEILELKQSTVAEIRSYQKPPEQVHEVMTATFLILGHLERETKVWKNVQALVGKTGKEGLKRRCLECEPENVNPAYAAQASVYLYKYGLDEVRDVSAGAATFYLWATSIVEEVDALQKMRKEEAERLRKKKKEAKMAEAEKKADKGESGTSNSSENKNQAQDTTGDQNPEVKWKDGESSQQALSEDDVKELRQGEKKKHVKTLASKSKWLMKPTSLKAGEAGKTVVIEERRVEKVSKSASSSVAETKPIVSPMPDTKSGEENRSETEFSKAVEDLKLTDKDGQAEKESISKNEPKVHFQEVKPKSTDELEVTEETEKKNKTVKFEEEQNTADEK